MPPRADPNKANIANLVKARTELYEAFRSAGSEAKLLSMRRIPKPSIREMSECMERFTNIHSDFQQLIDKLVMKYESIPNDDENGNDDKNSLIPSGYTTWSAFQKFVDDYFDDIQTKIGIKLDAMYLDSVTKESASSRMKLKNDMRLAKQYLCECESLMDPTLGTKDVLSERAEIELEGALDSFASLLVDIELELNQCKEILIQYPVESAIESEISVLESEYLACTHEQKKYRLKLKVNRSLRVHAGDSMPYPASDDGLPPTSERGRPFTAGLNVGLHTSPYQRLPTMCGSYPSYTAMRQSTGANIKSRARLALEDIAPLDNSASQHDVAKYYITKGGGGFYGAGGGPGYDTVDGLSYPNPRDGQDKGALPFKFKKQEFPVFSGLAVDYQEFKIKWSQVETQCKGRGAEWSLATLLKSHCKGDAEMVLDPFVASPFFYDEMWEALEQVFGPTEKVLESLVNQIIKLGDQMVDTRNQRSFLTWMNKIEKVRNTLVTVTPHWHYQITSEMVRKLANKLPHVVKRKWFDICQQVQRSDANVSLFNEFVVFLEQERAFVESEARLGVPPILNKKKDEPKKDRHESNFGDQKQNKNNRNISPQSRGGKGNPHGRSASPTPASSPPRGDGGRDGGRGRLDGRPCFFCDQSNPPHLMKSCQNWLALSPKEKREYLIKFKRCLACAYPLLNHKDDKCEQFCKQFGGRHLCKKDGCKQKAKRHGKWYSCNASSIVGNNHIMSKTAIFAINRAKISGTGLWLNAFSDPGSTGSFIMKSAARRRRLKCIGKIDLTVNTMGGGSLNMISWQYEIPIETNHGTHIMHACSVDDFLIKKLVPLDLDLLKSEFPEYEGDFEDLQYKHLTVELLIGLSDTRLLPKAVLHEGLREPNLQIRESELGDVVMGTYATPFTQGQENNSVSIQVGGQCCHVGDITLTPHIREANNYGGFPTDALLVPKLQGCDPKHDICIQDGGVDSNNISLDVNFCIGEQCKGFVRKSKDSKVQDSMNEGTLMLREGAMHGKRKVHFSKNSSMRVYKPRNSPSKDLVRTSTCLTKLGLGVSCHSSNSNISEHGEGHHLRTQQTSNLDSVCTGTEELLTKRESKTFKESVDRFLAGENLSTAITPLCGACKCGKCPIPGHTYSFREEQELQMIRSGLSFDPERGMWVACYPWISPPSVLPDNKWQAVKILESVERKLTRNPDWATKYQEQIDDLLQRNAARKLSPDEISNHEGPYFYVTHLCVLNPKSTSTPVRMVFNSSLKCQNGLSLNDCLAKGPDAYMNKLHGVLLRWREYKSAFVGDISKMFHAVAISEEDQQMHRFLWRDMRTTDPPDTYVSNVVTFGDKPAGTTAEEAMYMQARSMIDTHPLAVEAILRSTYVDDIDHSLDESGERCLSVVREVAEVLGKGGFKIKEWWLSGESSGRTSQELGIPYGALPDAQTRESKLKSSSEGHVGVLGVLWEPVSDTLRFQCPFNFHSKKEIEKGAPVLQLSEFDNKFPHNLSRRDVLRQVARIFDPQGILSPFILQAKLLLRESLREVGDNWDKHLSPALYFKWRDWFRSAYEIDGIIIQRCLKPENAIGQPSLIVLSDGSEEAYGFTAYVRWHIGNNQYQSNLLAAKCRIAPLNRVSIPQMELNGSLIATRARVNLLAEMTYHFDKVIHMVDSTTVLCQLNSLSSRFKVYEGVRVGEIQAGGILDSWFWVEGKLNVSDVVTRGKTPQELMDDDAWLYGPDFLKEDQSKWPVLSYQEVLSKRTSPLPGLKEVHTEQVFFCSTIRHTGTKVLNSNQNSVPTTVKFGPISPELQSKIKPENFKHISAFWKCWSFIFTCFALRSFKRARLLCGTRHYVEKTKEVIFKIVQKELSLEIDQDNMVVKTSKFSQFGTYAKDGICYVGLRARSVIAPVLLPYKSTFTALCMRSAHVDSGHLGRDPTLALFSDKYFCVRASVLASRICKHCYKCKKVDLALEKQLMGPVPDWKLSPAPPFYFVQLDLFGPYAVSGEVQKRVRGKGYGVIFVDLVSKAIHVEFAPSFNTDAFLLAYSRFTSLRGDPGELFSDPGSQLSGAGSEIKEIWGKMNNEKFKTNPVFKGASWHFSPAESPHRQGLVESMVKTVKRAFKVLEGNVLSFTEMTTLFYRIANLVNSRPIAKFKQDIASGDITVVTPNSLLLGRGQSIPSADVSFNPRLAPRLREVEEIVSAFWDQWIATVRPSITALKKWDTQKRNLQVGDVVVICASSKLSKTYQLGIVSKTFPSPKDNLVRKVDITVKRLKPSEKGGCPIYTGSSEVILSRSVQGLVLLVPIEEVDQTYGHTNCVYITKGI